MDEKLALCVLGSLAAFLFGLFLESAVEGRVRQTVRVVRGKGVGAWAANGVSWAYPLAKWSCRFPVVRRFATLAARTFGRRCGVVPGAEGALSLVIALATIVGAAVGVVTLSPFAALATFLLVCIVSVLRVGADGDAEREAMRAAVPDALHSMGACFQAGFSLQQTFRHLAQETKGPLGMRFNQAAGRLEAGQGVEGALQALMQDAAVPELRFVVVALDVQHQSGGSLRPVLEAARDAVESQLALRRSLRVQTAQARLSARVVTAMPFALIAVLSAVSKGFLEPFFANAAGLALLGVALAMQLAGVLAVRRMLAVEVV